MFEFGHFRLDPAERLLTKEQRPVQLTPKAFETLLVLVESAGHAFDKDELLKRIWPDSFVEEATLAKNISTLRKALGDGENGSRFIETLPKFGYRFVATVRRVPAEADHPSPFPASTAPPTANRKRRWAALPVLAGLTALLLLGAFLAWFRFQKPAAPAPERAVLAVLPFENLSGDESQDYLADGLTEEIIALLGGWDPERLGVIARTSVVKYKDSRQDVAEIGRELGAGYVLESSLRREGNRVRISVQLIETRRQTHLWAETYEREIGQVLPFQRELAETIARQIPRVLGPSPRAHRVASDRLDPEAHLLYLRGRYYWNKRTPEGLKLAVKQYSQALDREPNYAPAWAGMASAYAVFDEYQVLPAGEAFPLAKAAATRALELEPAQVEARAALALTRFWYDWDWAGAEQDFQQAIAINPNYSVARHWYGMFLMAMGRAAEARQQFEQALVTDPLSRSLPVAIGASYYHARQYDDAIAQYRRVVELQPASGGLRFHLGRAYVQKGMLEAAVREFQAGMELAGTRDGEASLAYGYAHVDRRTEARRLLEELQRLQGGGSPYYIAAVYAAMDEKELALRELQHAVDARVGRVTFLNVEPMFDPIRSDPRFRAICRRIGLP